MENQDIRWKQRFEHFSNAFKQLKLARNLKKEHTNRFGKTYYTRNTEIIQDK